MIPYACAGGELYDDAGWRAPAPADLWRGATFLNGGAACWRVVCDDLRARGARRVLLPAYLCPSLIDVLEQSGLACDFYHVRNDCSLDLEDLSAKAPLAKALLFINYFGFPHAPATLAALRDLQNVGMILIEDNAQAAYHAPSLGEYAFNSLRKFAPFDGGYLFTQRDITPHLARYAGRQSLRLRAIRDYRVRLGEVRRAALPEPPELDALFLQAEQAYGSDGVVWGDAAEEAQIAGYDWQRAAAARRRNYASLLQRLGDLPAVRPLFPTLPDGVVPLGLPITFEEVSRAAVLPGLLRRNVWLAAHWHEIATHAVAQRNSFAVAMSRKTLTLPVDPLTTPEKLAYLIQSLAEAIAEVG